MMRKKMMKIWQRFKSDEQGFSLVELMVVIVIIGLLTTMVVVNVMPSQDKAMVTKARSDVQTLVKSIESFRLETMRYPTMDEGLEALLKAPNSANSFRTEGFIKSLPKDPWGNEYQFLIPGERGTFDIFSFGADGALGGTGLNADIGNWVEVQE